MTAHATTKVRCKKCGRWLAVIENVSLRIDKRRSGVKVELVVDDDGTNQIVYLRCSCGKRWTVG